MKITFGLFLIAHALIHTSFISPQPVQKAGAPAWPFDITKSWILTPMGIAPETLKIIGIILTVIATVGFVASGLGWLGVPFLKASWIMVTVISSFASLLLILIYWNNWFVMGPLIDLAILYFIFYKGAKPL